MTNEIKLVCAEREAKGDKIRGALNSPFNYGDHEFDQTGICKHWGERVVWYELKGESKQKLEVGVDFPAGDYHIGLTYALDKIVDTQTFGWIIIRREDQQLYDRVLESTYNGDGHPPYIVVTLEDGDEIILDKEFRGMLCTTTY